MSDNYGEVDCCVNIWLCKSHQHLFSSVTWLLFWIYGLCQHLLLTYLESVFQYVVIPTRRSSALAIQILMSHALGDAGSPYIVGLVCNCCVHNGDLTKDWSALRYPGQELECFEMSGLQTWTQGVGLVVSQGQWVEAKTDADRTVTCIINMQTSLQNTSLQCNVM